MPLVRMSEAWDDPDWIFELKYDGFRSLAFVGSDRVRLVSRKQFVYRRYGDLCAGLGSALNGHEAVLDGEIVCLDERGVSQFNDLLYCRRPACFAAFDLLWLHGHDLRRLPLIERKRRLRSLIRRGPSLLYVSHFDGWGTALFGEVCRLDLEGIVAKYKYAPYGLENSWMKIKNQSYSQVIGRDELFKKRSA